MTDDYWGPMPDDSEYPTPRERLDDGECERLRALLRRWVGEQKWATSVVGMGRLHYMCPFCGKHDIAYSVVPDIIHTPGCLVGDTLKELGE